MIGNIRYYSIKDLSDINQVSMNNSINNKDFLIHNLPERKVVAMAVQLVS